MEKEHRIFCIIGKSASGKDTIYERLIKDPSLALRPVILYTTRPKREGELEGREYHFRTQASFLKALDEGKIIEYRKYDTVYGPWYYYTEDDGQIDFGASDYLCEGPLVFFKNLQQYYGRDRVVPIYVWVDDRTRLLRAIDRESRQEHPGYAEVCRRFLADETDFSREKLAGAGITQGFENRDLDACVQSIRALIGRQA